jgi:WXG100 family type VII secretion target
MSNADLLQANASELEATGQEFISCGTQLEQLLTTMRNRTNSLRGSFQGSAAESFSNKMEVLFQQLRTLCDEVTEMGGDLNATASDVRQLQAIAQGRLQD